MMKTYWDTLATPPLPASPADGPGTVTLTGTDGSSATSSEFQFQSAPNSNVVVHINPNTSPPTVEIGVYYV